MTETRLNLVADLDALAGTDPLIPALIKFLYDLRESLPMFVVYDHPTDQPEHFVARMWRTLPEPLPLYFMVRSEKLDTIRSFLDAAGLVHLSRNPDDDPAILETWL